MKARYNYYMKYLNSALKSLAISTLLLTLVLSSIYTYTSVNAEGEESSSFAGGSEEEEKLAENPVYQQSCYPAVVFEQQHLAKNTDFVDIDYSAANKEITYLAELGVVSGTSANVFSPNQVLTRAEYLKMVFLAFGHSVEKGTYVSQFTDMSSAHWAADLVATARKLGIINGYVDGSFKPDQQITYAEAIKLAARATNCSFFTTSLAQNGVAFQTYADDWYVGYMNWARQYGIYSPANGDANYKMVRWNGAKLTYNIMEYVNSQLGITMRIHEEL